MYQFTQCSTGLFHRKVFQLRYSEKNSHFMAKNFKKSLKAGLKKGHRLPGQEISSFSEGTYGRQNWHYLYC